MYPVFLIVDLKLYRESIYSASTEGGIRHTFRNFDTLGVFLRQKKWFLASQAQKIDRYFIARFVKGDKSFLILHISWVILKKFSCSLFQYIVQWSFLSLMMEKYLQDKGNLLLLSVRELVVFEHVRYLLQLKQKLKYTTNLLLNGKTMYTMFSAYNNIIPVRAHSQHTSFLHAGHHISIEFVPDMKRTTVIHSCYVIIKVKSSSASTIWY